MKFSREAILAGCVALGLGAVALIWASRQHDRTRARETFQAASGSYRGMFRAVGHVRARIERQHDSTGYYGGTNPVIDLPRDGAGRIPVTLNLKWTSDLVWDRASGNAVCETVRVSHKVNGEEHVRSPRPALFHSVDGVSTGHYSVVTSSLDDSQPWQPSAQEDVGLTKDYTALATLAGQRIDKTLDHYVRTVLRAEGATAYRVGITEGGGELRVEISDPPGSANEGLRDRFTFRQSPTGLLLVAFEQSRPDGGITTLTVDYSEVPVQGGGSTLLPTRWVEEQGWGASIEGKPTSKETIQAVEVNAFAGPLDSRELREHNSLRYGDAAANTMEEWLRTAPKAVEPAVASEQ